jgi:hypothetical protein
MPTVHSKLKCHVRRFREEIDQGKSTGLEDSDEVSLSFAGRDLVFWIRTFRDPSARCRAKHLLQVVMDPFEPTAQKVCASSRPSLRGGFQKPVESAKKSVDVLEGGCDKSWLHVRTGPLLAIMDCANTVSRNI